MPSCVSCVAPNTRGGRAGVLSHAKMLAKTTIAATTPANHRQFHTSAAASGGRAIPEDVPASDSASSANAKSDAD